MNLKNVLREELRQFRLLNQEVPSSIVSLFVVSVVIMNLLANKEIITPFPYLVMDAGMLVSWISFLAMDMITKHFNAKAAIHLTIFALGVNLLFSLTFFLIGQLPGNWSPYYTYMLPEINLALDSMFMGNAFILFGSSLAFLTGSVSNALINQGIGKLLINNTTFNSFALRSFVSTGIGQFIDNVTFNAVVSFTLFGWTWTQVIFSAFLGCLIELAFEIIFSPLSFRMLKTWEKDGIGLNYMKYMEDVS